MLTFLISQIYHPPLHKEAVLCLELSLPVEPAGGLTELVRLGGSGSRRRRSRSQRTSGDNIVPAVDDESDNLL